MKVVVRRELRLGPSGNDPGGRWEWEEETTLADLPERRHIKHLPAYLHIANSAGECWTSVRAKR